MKEKFSHLRDAARAPVRTSRGVLPPGGRARAGGGRSVVWGGGVARGGTGTSGSAHTLALHILAICRPDRFTLLNTTDTRHTESVKTNQTSDLNFTLIQYYNTTIM